MDNIGIIDMYHISVLGAGSWGTALAAHLVKNNQDVVLWSHRASQVKEMRKSRENPKLPGSKLPEALKYTADLEEACRDKDLLVFAVPSTATRETAEKINNLVPDGQRIVLVSKGIEENTLFTQEDIVKDVLPGSDVAVLSGPSHAEEVIAEMPTVVVSGARNKDTAVFVQSVFMNSSFRVYISSDVLGIELGGSLKNVIALAAGMSDGLGFGDNAKAALITRGVHEMTSLAVKMGGKVDTLNGLTGIGDLIVTCESRHSRNRKCGMLIGQGMSTNDAVKEVQMVVEGIYSAKAALGLGKKYEVDLPIVEAVNQVLFEDYPVKDAVIDLMTRERKSEFSGDSW